MGTISHTLTALQTLEAASLSPLAVVVSESPDSPPIAETLESLRRFVGASLVFAVGRGQPISDQMLERIMELR